MHGILRVRASRAPEVWQENSLGPPARVLPGSRPHTASPHGQRHLMASVGTWPPLTRGPSYLTPGRPPELGGPQLCLPWRDLRACQGPPPSRPCSPPVGGVAARLPLLLQQRKRLQVCSSPGLPPACWVTPGRSLWALYLSPTDFKWETRAPGAELYS